ncbi:TRAP dicarboxylate transporter, DctM subunit [Arthrobacter sp. PAMC 25486]|uniref:TRAP transporter large permease n=1 Tax=Arthrobacter sp. PAMC 25486 TaxID=1494608 RepID=UPI000535DCD6|nr:TRAP transporter large permease [Arthrobacter sp. PAMC 25486]AIY00951.1 TRAP dicarboxylate transporter, DctM subunit [Arthrobacter sp. PAMC 25486]
MTITALIMLSVFLVLLFLSVPISFALAGAVVAVLIFDPTIELGFEVIAQRMYGGLESSAIMAIPFFILAGNIMTKGGISSRLVEFANSLIGGVRGGMGYALVLASGFFAALSGSAPATVIAIGMMLYPDMVKLGYPKGRVASLLVVSGGLGPILPPSIIMIVYATMTGASVGNMFKSGMVIGLMILVVLMILVALYAKKEKWPKSDQKFSAAKFRKSFLTAIPALLLPVIILGGIYSGLVTPTESAVLAVVWSLIVSLFVYRQVSFKELGPIFISSAKSSAMILFILAASTAFSWLFAYSGTSASLVNGIISMNLSPMMFLIIVAILLLVMGIFIEGIATAVLMVPILWPIASALGIDVIHFGMVVSIANVVGTMTPPVAVSIFAAQSVTNLKPGVIVKNQMPFFLGYLAIFVLVVLVPSVSTFLIR